jgi:diaminohydroxyphosphoribosylaminopyrimidine deaminase / 5-amino-6-(5-phosphoribosylamino)uracil reductase
LQAALYSDSDFMQLCINLAVKGLGDTLINPLVGAVLVHTNANGEQQIIGQGYHKKYGGPHAEVECIRSVLPENSELIKQSTLYVCLEPCNHTGKTPPCSEFIVQQKVPKVVIGCKDFSEKVNGAGIQYLRENGVEVIENVLHKESIELNKRFFTSQLLHRPYIILKWAQTADCFISNADKSPIQISNTSTNIVNHTWRAQEMAIIVGYNTVMSDNPTLTVRDAKGQSPLRIVWDADASLPLAKNIFGKESGCLIFNKVKNESHGNIRYVKADGLLNMLGYLKDIGVQSVIVEGGTNTINEFLADDMFDEIRLIKGELKIGNGYKAPTLPSNLLLTEQLHVLDNYIEIYRKHQKDNNADRSEI